MATTYCQLGPTYFGSQSRTRIDHIALPVSAAGRVLQCNTMMRQMKKLQVIANAEPRDHAPVLLRIVGGHPDCVRKEPGRRIDRDAVMRCLTSGHRRAEFVGAAEDKLKQKKAEVTSMVRREDAEGVWRALADAANEAAAEVFSKVEEED
eukprot:6728645-Heterocapsa_arctica.AAC.1